MKNTFFSTSSAKDLFFILLEWANNIGMVKINKKYYKIKVQSEDLLFKAFISTVNEEMCSIEF